MKIKNLKIVNLGAIADIDLSLDKPLILFYGEIKQGKTTILNAIRYAFGGAFPDDLLLHGCLEGMVKLTTTEGTITREFYRADDSTVKARPLAVVIDGKRVPKPVEWLKKFLNPFMLDGDYLANMPTDARKKYFVELFEASTTALDKEHAECEATARELRATIKGFGDIDVKPVERVNVAELKFKLDLVREQNANEKAAVLDAIKKQDEHNAAWKTRFNLTAKLEADHNALLAKLAQVQHDIAVTLAQNAQVREWLTMNPQKSATFEPDIIPTLELEDAVSNAAAQNVRAEIYEGNVAKLEKRKAAEKSVNELEAKQRDIKAQRVALLERVTTECGVPGLVFHEGGAFSYEGTDAGMLSTSQIMKLSSDLSALYPEGVGLDLIDRAESLGASIFEYVEKAKAGNKTILATIVGERPATIPDEVGVFVVKGGALS